MQASAFRAAVAGEALGEKEVDELEALEEQGEDSDVEVMVEEVTVLEEEMLYDPEDDIVD